MIDSCQVLNPLFLDFNMNQNNVYQRNNINRYLQLNIYSYIKYITVSTNHISLKCLKITLLLGTKN